MIKELKVFATLILFLTGAILLSGCISNNLNQEEGQTTLDIYPGSETYDFPALYYSIMNIPESGVTIKAYKVSNTNVQDILAWYENKMNSTGWEFQEKIPVTTLTMTSGSLSFGGVVYKKENTGKGIWAWQQSSDNANEVFYVIATGPWSKFSSEAEQLPSSDQAQGEEPISRYPGSVLISYDSRYEGNKQIISINYGTNDEASKVVSWYKQQLQNTGWTLDEESSDETSYSLSFSRNAESVDISILKPSETTAYTEIDIYYTNEQLPSQDLVTGEEPMERYPGAVMLDHQITTYQNIKVIEIYYGTNNEVDSVLTWYENYFTSNGWQIANKETSQSEATLVATNGNSISAEIEITSGAYTTIHITYTEIE